MTRSFIVVAFTLLTCFSATAQIPLTSLPSGGNKKAAVSERVGLTDISIHYDRPAVKGREGKIWGTLVPVDFIDPGFGSSKSAPWRAGANENTTIEFSRPVKIEGEALPAGKYGFFIAYDPNESTLIFSKNAGSWGSYFYDEREDALRVKVKPRAATTSTEWLKYEFLEQTENAATIALTWEKLTIPFRVETNYIEDQLASFRQELRTEKGFMWQSWQQAANWCLQRNVNLPQALQWADSASSPSFGGNRSFIAHSTKAQILEKLGRKEEAATIIKQAFAIATMNEIHQYGRQLVQQRKGKEALEVFRSNFEKNPNQFTTLVGLARGYAAVGDFQTALKYAEQALPMTAEINNRNNLQAMIARLREGKDIN
ncbi:MAG TPA: DUF2911 domain-containing protein [Flavisolibacter sp.]